MLAGQDVELFYRLSLTEISLIIEAARVRDQQLGWIAASYLGFPYHEKDKHPEFPRLKQRVNENSEADMIKASTWMRVMANGG